MGAGVAVYWGALHIRVQRSGGRFVRVSARDARLRNPSEQLVRSWEGGDSALRGDGERFGFPLRSGTGQWAARDLQNANPQASRRAASPALDSSASVVDLRGRPRGDRRAALGGTINLVPGTAADPDGVYSTGPFERLWARSLLTKSEPGPRLRELPAGGGSPSRLQVGGVCDGWRYSLQGLREERFSHRDGPLRQLAGVEAPRSFPAGGTEAPAPEL